VPRIEVYGSRGSLSVPDPNTFGGPVLVQGAGEREWREVALTHGFTQNSRGLGVADMSLAIHEGRAHRASGQLAYHVLDIMHAIHESAEQGQHITLTSSCPRPEPLAADQRF
jgi:predicted dehydrogenase